MSVFKPSNLCQFHVLLTKLLLLLSLSLCVSVQIFVRQKNRSCARSPENPIKVGVSNPSNFWHIVFWVHHHPLQAFLIVDVFRLNFSVLLWLLRCKFPLVYPDIYDHPLLVQCFFLALHSFHYRSCNLVIMGVSLLLSILLCFCFCVLSSVYFLQGQVIGLTTECLLISLIVCESSCSWLC